MRTTGDFLLPHMMASKMISTTTTSPTNVSTRQLKHVRPCRFELSNSTHRAQYKEPVRDQEVFIVQRQEKLLDRHLLEYTSFPEVASPLFAIKRFDRHRPSVEILEFFDLSQCNVFAIV